MGEFITEKEIERLLEFETRNLPIPEPLSKPGGGFISIFKKSPFGCSLIVGKPTIY